MTMERVSPPLAPAVSIDAARQALRRDDDALDLSIGIAVNALVAEAEQITRCAFVNRGMRVTLDRFADAIRLASPTYSVESVQFLDANGQVQTLDPVDYYVDKVTKPGYIVPASGKRWPSTFARVNAVTVDFTAGYGPTDATVPAEAKHYVLARLQQQFDPSSKVTKADLVGLLDSLKVYG